MTLLPTYYYKVKKPTHASMMNKHYSQRKTTSIINEIIHASMQTMQIVKVMQTHACQHGDRMCTYPRLQRKKNPQYMTHCKGSGVVTTTMVPFHQQTSKYLS